LDATQVLATASINNTLVGLYVWNNSERNLTTGTAARVNGTEIAEYVWNQSLNLSVGIHDTTKAASGWLEYISDILYWLWFFGGGN